MKMNVNAVIHCLKDVKAIDCLYCPYFAERKGSIASCRMKRLDEAKEIIEKYQKIQEVMEHWVGTQCVEVDLQTLFKIREVLEDGSN